MKKDGLRNMLKCHLENAKELLLKDGYLVPVAFIMHGNEIDVIALTFKTQKDKEEQMSILKKMAKKKDADAVCCIFESWYVMSEKSNIDLDVPPSKNPDRKECIFIIGECEEGNIVMFQQFERNGEEIILGEKIIDNIGVGPSRFDFGIKDRKINRNVESRGLN